MAGKTTSAGYRLPVTSEYHQKCVSNRVKELTEKTNPNKTFAQEAHRNCNTVMKEKLWSEYVHNELRSTKNWEKNWGFLLEYDYHGQVKPKKGQLPERVSYYNSTDVPSTTSKQFGFRVEHPGSLDMLRIERTTSHKKRKTDLENYMS